MRSLVSLFNEKSWQRFQSNYDRTFSGSILQSSSPTLAFIMGIDNLTLIKVSRSREFIRTKLRQIITATFLEFPTSNWFQIATEPRNNQRWHTQINKSLRPIIISSTAPTLISKYYINNLRLMQHLLHLRNLVNKYAMYQKSQTRKPLKKYWQTSIIFW